jgi:FKBP-type peptidyl-prolyl cis-trans isomerase
MFPGEEDVKSHKKKKKKMSKAEKKAAKKAEKEAAKALSKDGSKKSAEDVSSKAPSSLLKERRYAGVGFKLTPSWKSHKHAHRRVIVSGLLSTTSTSSLHLKVFFSIQLPE